MKPKDRGRTKAEHDAAVAEAKKLATTLGKGWTTRVWDNLGWHYAVLSPCQRISIHGGSSSGAYTALLGEPGSLSGRWVGRGVTPQQARDAVVKAAKDSLAEIGAILEDL